MAPKNAVMLFVCALIWGTAFVAQSLGNGFMGPITFQAIRSVLGSLTLAPFVIARRDKVREGESGKVRADRRKATIAGGAATGFFLCSASILQQTAMISTDVGKCGFITALYIVLVPVLAYALGRKSGIKLWISVAIAAVGLYLLCVSGTMAFGASDLMLVGCAFLFACQILSIDHFVRFADGIELSFAEFLFSAVFSFVLAFLLEKPAEADIAGGLLPLVYAGVFSSGIAYTLQILGQRGQDPAVSSLIMSLESVISVIAGWLLLGQRLSLRELLGCAFMFTAVVLAQLPEKTRVQT